MLIPVGTIEQHGHHLPIDTDKVIVDSICDMASRRAPADLVLAPLIPYGYDARTMGFPGTVSISPTTFVAYCFDVCASLAQHEFKYLLLVNGHGSNQHLCEAASRRVVVETRARCAALSWWLHEVTFAEEVHGTFKAVQESLALTGCTLADVVDCQVWLRDARDFYEFNRIFADYFEGNQPVRSVFRTDFMFDFRVEIKVTAYKPL